MDELELPKNKTEAIDFALYLQDTAKSFRDDGMTSTADDYHQAGELILKYANNEMPTS